MIISDVNRSVTKNKKTKRLGRGSGSGQGKTGGRGHKGQGQLAGWTAHPGFEGGQLPLYRRIPKRGFHNRFGVDVFGINVGNINEHFQAGEVVDEAALRQKHLVRGRIDRLKILGDGELTKKLKIMAHAFSKTAEEKIRAAGGEVVVVPGPAPVVKGVKKTKTKKDVSKKVMAKKPKK